MSEQQKRYFMNIVNGSDEFSFIYAHDPELHEETDETIYLNNEWGMGLSDLYKKTALVEITVQEYTLIENYEMKHEIPVGINWDSSLSRYIMENAIARTQRNKD